MTRQGDLYMLVLVIGIIAVWLYIRFRRWIYAPMRIKLPYPEPSPYVRTDAVRLLEEAGYEVISGKMKVPLVVELDDEPMGSRLFIDYFARKDHELYVVKLSKQRKPMQWTASGVRDQLMIYHALFKEIHGILYVDLEKQQVRKIKFDVGKPE